MQESASMHKIPTPFGHSRMNQKSSEEEEKKRGNLNKLRFKIKTYPKGKNKLFRTRNVLLSQPDSLNV